MPAGVLYILFFFSGISGLIYQVVWVRAFGLVFGNTVYSSALVVAIFMLGLGAGSYLLGRWADRRYAQAADSLLSTYGYFELTIAALGVAVSLLLPHLTALSAFTSSYVVDRTGWFVLSPTTYVARATIAVVLLAPITTLMGGTLTLLIRYRVRRDVESAGGWKIAALYGINTLGAAIGAWLTDFVLVPAAGVLVTQLLAVTLNVIAGVGALLPFRVTSGSVPVVPGSSRTTPTRVAVRMNRRGHEGTQVDGPISIRPALVAAALTLIGFAGLGMEILWLRHFTLLLGGFRAVFSLVLTVILLGVGIGALVGGAIDRRTSRPAEALMVVEAMFIASVLAGLAAPDLAALGLRSQTLESGLGAMSPAERWLTELWYNARPILMETAVPSLLMGCAFPLANAIVQHAEAVVGRRAGFLYLANTTGAVCGSLIVGFVLLPALGIQGSATVLMVTAAAAIAIVAIALRLRQAALGSALIVGAAMAVWLQLPTDYLLRRAMTPPQPDERVLTISEGVNEIIMVTELPGRGRGLITNNHAMASTALLDQRYMRALAHIPLLSIDRPSRVLVIGFGAGNSTHAAALHPSVERIDVVDLSRHILEHARYFTDANHGILTDRRVSVYVNDGRQHLQLRPQGTYDLITLEPPPIAHAGVAALYSREFYQLARSRLKPGGYLSQWLPAYQVPAETSLAMVRAFLDAFPQSVLLSGMHEELLLLGTTAPRIEIDPNRIASAMQRAPAVRDDLQRVDLGSVTSIVGTFVGSADTLARATAGSPSVTDDRPLQEYGVRSILATAVAGVPAALFDLRSIATWCRRCFDGDEPAPAVAGLDVYLTLLDDAYHAPAVQGAARARPFGERQILGSTYLGAVLPDTADVNRDLALALADEGRRAEAVAYLRRAIGINPDDAAAQHELGSLLLEDGKVAEAADHLRATLRTRPDSAAAHNDLGVALASMGQAHDAIEQFRAAVSLEPNFTEARRNLESALQNQR